MNGGLCIQYTVLNQLSDVQIREKTLGNNFKQVEHQDFLVEQQLTAEESSLVQI